MKGLSNYARQARWVQSVAIDKILIANRGEISCRVTETARKMGIKTVAVHCDAESNGKHVGMADEAYRLGPPPASSSYLQSEKIIEVAKMSGAQAIHPGYGFLSENAGFAKLCEENGVEFIGPPASAIISMGSKSESKLIMEAASVSCVPGYHGEDQSDETLQKEADKVGYPLLIKAVLGGGGKGMRVVQSSKEFKEELDGARREAIAFFKDDRVLMERYIERSRHVEVQVFCDKHGNGVYLFERDCSVQRRHQKVLEEAPAPGLTEELRKEMGETAVRAAQAVSYVGAGTVEFIFDVDTNEYFFMEMNTRLQVEHPVTEMITGLDLVRLQINVARGLALPFSQEDLKITGHAIEARIYAEDPYNNFLPGSGKLEYVHIPVTQKEGTTIRVDSGFRSGDDVLVHYDPMIAKLIVHADTREDALAAMDQALSQYHIVGIPTNIEFLRKSVTHPDFATGCVTTSFIKENEEDLLVRAEPASQQLALGAVAQIACELAANKAGAPPFEPSFFRLNLNYARTVTFLTGKDMKPVDVEVEALSKDRFTVTCNGHTHAVNVMSLDPAALIVSIDGARHAIRVIATQESLSLLTNNGTITLFKDAPSATFGDIANISAGGLIQAPMPGKITKVFASNGDHVNMGDDILVMEAMKMEQKLKAPATGIVEGLTVKAGSMVNGHQTLAMIKTEEKEE
ncbi:Methylcrotonoyl-CoA carboxylase subunit alpha [Diplonema papillatum]|nr:Methylcrotonoyl-CoA carboxylase subunit alpha [Diplonema papillatum]